MRQTASGRRRRKEKVLVRDLKVKSLLGRQIHCRLEGMLTLA